jgi:hypothetical protein
VARAPGVNGECAGQGEDGRDSLRKKDGGEVVKGTVQRRGAAPLVTAHGGVGEVHHIVELLKDATGGHYAHRQRQIFGGEDGASLLTEVGENLEFAKLGWFPMMKCGRRAPGRWRAPILGLAWGWGARRRAVTVELEVAAMAAGIGFNMEEKEESLGLEEGGRGSYTRRARGGARGWDAGARRKRRR